MSSPTKRNKATTAWRSAAFAIKRSFPFPDGIGPKNIHCLYHEELESLTKHFDIGRIALRAR